ncbi:cysteine--tRNA ligase 2, cytoplasmic isoform X2 [Hevea brasiliensis]|uniref:cysteine--tRNA ligase 2, cytoplasmic isoform X2 n=1 Tax=Hevea brasiliensis TaxID=3981 RepID=UPI000B78E253|nr:cysteine--tRNA ligase 2, cytoplasmic isoform X2 [Hevea brasiliensis]
MAKELDFKIFNTMTKTMEVFKPLVPGKVRMYVCGVTSYDLSHIGHARAAVIFDVLFRYLQHLGYEVTYVRNFTDIDDKIIRRANELGEDPLSLSSRFCEEYLVDMDSLQCLLPTHQPRVTNHMEQIKDMITQIINNGFAYVVEGDVFFAVDKFPNYGQLSGQKLENTRAGERVAVDTRKRNPADFALWKAAKPGEPSWESPWGPGRPGWHIECSAMSAHYLTVKFDIHGGGSDLAFPHHENEITQSVAACQESRVSYWMHNGHVTNNNEKMSKSLGNFFTIRQVTERYHPLALRHFLMSAHYRSPLNYTVLQLESSSDAIFYIYQTLQDCEDALSLFQDGSMKEGVGLNVKKVGISADAQKCINKLREEFETKMSDDLSTSHILIGAFQEALKFINSSLSMLKKQQKQQLSLIQSLTEIEKEAKLVLKILGLLPPCTYSEVLQQLKEKALKRAELTEQDVLGLIEERAMARKNKDFSRSDQIRADLTAKGIALMDVGKETVWRPCVPVEPEQDAPSVVVEQNPPPSVSS